MHKIHSLHSATHASLQLCATALLMPEGLVMLNHTQFPFCHIFCLAQWTLLPLHQHSTLYQESESLSWPHSVNSKKSNSPGLQYSVHWPSASRYNCLLLASITGETLLSLNVKILINPAAWYITSVRWTVVKEKKNERMNETAWLKDMNIFMVPNNYTESQKRLSQFTQSCGHKKT